MLEKVQSGSAFQPAARTWNAFVDAAVDFKQRHKTGRRDPKLTSSRVALLIDVVNNSGSDLGRYFALKLTEPAVLPDAPNEDEFLNRIIMKGDTPDADSKGRYAITQVGLSDGQIGSAIAAGVTIANVSIMNTSDRYAEATNGENHLTSGTSGSAQILWVAGGVGTATATGVQYAIIRIGSDVPDVRYGKITADKHAETYLVLTPCAVDGTAITGADTLTVMVHADGSAGVGPWPSGKVFPYELLPEPMTLYNMAHTATADCTGVLVGGTTYSVAGLIHCVLVKDGGSDGSKTAAPTYTYTVTIYNTANYITPGTGMTPLDGRVNGSFVDAVNGLGYYDAGGDFQLLYAFETPNTNACT